MERKDRIDAAGAAVLLTFSILMGLNQVLIKLVNAGMQPVFQAGLRSALAFIVVLVYALVRHRRLSVTDGSFWWGVLAGTLFSVEFLLLFQSVEFTNVARVSVFFYTMPFWVALGAHFLIPGERLTRIRALGLVLASAGVALALLRNASPAGPDALIGDLMGLVGAVFWAGIVFVVRLTNFSRASSEMQILYQLATSAVLLLALAPLFGPLIREMTLELGGIFTFQVLVVVSFGFLAWFWALRVYPASDMASYSFLTPVFGVLFSWLILSEEITAEVIAALVMVAVGIYLVNRKGQPGA
jgi:drug/metabolite transporter (DMT)-like permease